MDYSLKYQNYYNENFIIFENFIKESFKNFHLQNRPFSYAMNNYINEYTIQNPNKIKSKIDSLHTIFKKRFTLYNSNHLQLIFENDIKNAFKNLDLPENIEVKNFENLIELFAKIESYNDAQYLCGLNNRLLEMIYLTNRFDAFELKKYDCIIENVPIYEELAQILYPETKTNEYEEETIENQLTVRQKVVLVKDLIYSNKFEHYSERKKANLIALLINANESNIRKYLSESDMKVSEQSKNLITDFELIKNLT